MNHVAAMLFCLVTITGCSSPSGTDGAPPMVAGEEVDEQAPVDAAPPPKPSTLPTRVEVSSPVNFTNDFTGPAMGFMRQFAIQPSPDLLSDVTEHVRNAKGLDGCRSSLGNNQAYLADIDGDGTLEGIALYSLDNCGAPDNMVRTLMVMRQQADMGWQPVLEVATSVKRSVQRPIVAIGDGKITLAPEPDGFGSIGEAEVLVVPQIPGQNE